MHMPKSRAATMEGWKERMLSKLALAGKAPIANNTRVWGICRLRRLVGSGQGAQPPKLNSACVFLGTAGGTGVAVGSLLAVLNHMPLVRYTASSTASFVLLMGCFSGECALLQLRCLLPSTATAVLTGSERCSHGERGLQVQQQQRLQTAAAPPASLLPLVPCSDARDGALPAKYRQRGQ